MSAATALDWFAHDIDHAPGVPMSPVGPDLARGLSTDFGQDAFDALDWEVAFEVDVLLTYGSRGTYYVPDPRGRLYGYERRWLPARAVVELEGENAAWADVALWPNLSDDGYDE